MINFRADSAELVRLVPKKKGFNPLSYEFYLECVQHYGTRYNCTFEIDKFTIFTCSDEDFLMIKLRCPRVIWEKPEYD